MKMKINRWIQMHLTFNESGGFPTCIYVLQSLEMCSSHSQTFAMKYVHNTTSIKSKRFAEDRNTVYFQYGIINFPIQIIKDGGS